jgi:hypothetical protein
MSHRSRARALLVVALVLVLGGTAAAVGQAADHPAVVTASGDMDRTTSSIESTTTSTALPDDTTTTTAVVVSTTTTRPPTTSTTRPPATPSTTAPARTTRITAPRAPRVILSASSMQTENDPCTEIYGPIGLSITVLSDYQPVSATLAWTDSFGHSDSRSIVPNRVVTMTGSYGADYVFVVTATDSLGAQTQASTTLHHACSPPAA